MYVYVRCAISPCLRFLSAGSEDRSVRIFDIVKGSSRELARITAGHRDSVVGAVAFNPLFPQLATGAYDGNIRFYADPHFDCPYEDHISL
jgi:WD40 repeat protein